MKRRWRGRGIEEDENLNSTSRSKWKISFGEKETRHRPGATSSGSEVRLRSDRDGHRDPQGKRTARPARRLPRQSILDFIRQRFLEYPVVYLEQDHDYYAWQEEPMRDTWR